jgi:hypothetical protein
LLVITSSKAIIIITKAVVVVAKATAEAVEDEGVGSSQLF